MKSFFKCLIDFLNKGWVNFLVGDLILFISILIFFHFRFEPDFPSLFLGFSLFIGSDLMGYGFSTFLSGHRKKKEDTSSSE